MNEHICYPDEIEEQAEWAERFKIDPDWGIGWAFAELDKWRLGRAYPGMSDTERAKINPLEFHPPAPGASMFGSEN